MAVENGDYETGRLQAEEALAVHRELHDAQGVARSVFMLGYAAIESGDFGTAKPHFEEAVGLFNDLGLEHLALMAAWNLAWAYDELGDTDRARLLFEETLARARATKNRSLEAFCLDGLEPYAREDGQIAYAFSMAADALRIRRDLGDVHHQLDALSRFAAIHAVAGHPETAALLVSCSLARFEEVGLNVPPYLVKRNDATLMSIHSQLDEAAFTEAWEQGRALTLDEAVALALDSAN